MFGTLFSRCYFFWTEWKRRLPNGKAVELVAFIDPFMQEWNPTTHTKWGQPQYFFDITVYRDHGFLIRHCERERFGPSCTTPSGHTHAQLHCTRPVDIRVTYVELMLLWELEKATGIKSAPFRSYFGLAKVKLSRKCKDRGSDRRTLLATFWGPFPRVVRTQCKRCWLEIVVRRYIFVVEGVNVNMNALEIRSVCCLLNAK